MQDEHVSDANRGGDPSPVPVQPAGKFTREFVEFVGSVSRVRTLSDGGLRFEFDVSEDATLQAAQLMECKRWGAVLTVVCTPLKNDKDTEDAISKGKKRKSGWETTG